MSIIAWLAIGLAVITVILVILFVTQAFTPYTPTTMTPMEMSSLYTPSNPWSWDEKNTAGPVDGPEGKCNVYTFAARGRFLPAVMGYTSINSCAAGCSDKNSCVCSAPQTGQTCVDDDQISAQKMKHRCQETNANWELRTTGYCTQQDGRPAAPGTIEEFYTHCSLGPQPPPGSATTANAGRCEGALSLVAFNVAVGVPGPTALDNALCLNEPRYTTTLDPSGRPIYSNLSPLTTRTCDMRYQYQGYPSQLFRIQRATYDGATFIPGQSGSFARIIHRPTGYALAPALRMGANNQPDLKQPIVGEPLQLLPRSVGNDGYWWYLSPQRQDPNYEAKQPIRLIARSQLVYIPDPKQVPPLIDVKAMWTYLTRPGSISISPSSMSSDGTAALITKPFIVVDGNALPEVQAPSQLAQAMYIDYGIANLITQDVSNFDFDGPFRPL